MILVLATTYQQPSNRLAGRQIRHASNLRSHAPRAIIDFRTLIFSLPVLPFFIFAAHLPMQRPMEPIVHSHPQVWPNPETRLPPISSLILMFHSSNPQRDNGRSQDIPQPWILHPSLHGPQPFWSHFWWVRSSPSATHN